MITFISELTHGAVRKLLAYDRETGIFTLRKDRSGRAPNRAGDRIGTPHKDGYLKATVLGQNVLLHRLAWFYETGEWPRNEIDHIDGDPTNNRFCNLREATRTVNMQNRYGAMPNNKSGLLGVSSHRSGEFYARITVNGSRIPLGRFSTPGAAHHAYMDAKRKLHAHSIQAPPPSPPGVSSDLEP